MEQKAMKAEFLHTYDTYADELFRFCFFKVSNYERAEDLTQEVFTKFWQELRNGKKIQNARAYLYTLARNLIIDWYRKKKESSLDVLSENGIELMGSSGGEVEDFAQHKEILSFIDSLDPSSREIVLLRYVEGWNPADIAHFTGDSVNVISVRLNRAIKKIQDAMQSLPTTV
jgi:RNA polymerase sigma-70 factor (ECF subfamily)